MSHRPWRTELASYFPKKEKESGGERKYVPAGNSPTLLAAASTVRVHILDTKERSQAK